MGSDTAHDADTLRIHHDAREQHINTAGIKAMVLASQTYGRGHVSSEPKRLRVYVSGPMTGMPFLNYPAFISAGLQLTGAGFDVVNPATLDHSRHDGSWASHMRVDIKALMDCDGVALLPGWQDSKGARTECDLAQTLGLEVRDLADWLLPMAGTHRPAAACASGQACVGAVADSVRSTSYDVAPGECVMCFERDPEQQRKCAEIHPGVCDVRPLPGAGDSEGGECA